MNAEGLENDKSGSGHAGQGQDEYERREISSAHAPPAARVSCPTRETISALEQPVLQAYLRQRRWFASKDQELGLVRPAACICVDAAGFAFAELEVELPNGAERYLLPLVVAWDAKEIPESNRELALALVEQNGEVGHLIDAFGIPRFPCEVLAMLKSRTVVATDQWGEIRFIPTDRIDALDCADQNVPDIRWLSAEQSNSSLVVDEEVVLKLVRRLIGGVHPEAEMTRYLTARGYANAGPLFGEVVRVDTDGVPHTLCILQGFISNDGDAWQFVLSTTAVGTPEAHLRVVDNDTAGLGTDVGAAILTTTSHARRSAAFAI
jgi:maltose alpha-D-glucosyltransferase/alpha-amylase